MSWPISSCTDVQMMPTSTEAVKPLVITVDDHLIAGKKRLVDLEGSN